MFDIGRTVSLDGRGRLPESVHRGLEPQGGTATASFDGRRPTLPVDLFASGTMFANGKSIDGSAHVRALNVFDVNVTSWSVTGGSGRLVGIVQEVRRGHPFRGALS